MGKFWDGGISLRYSKPQIIVGQILVNGGPGPKDQIGWDLCPRLTSRMVSNRLKASVEARIWPMVFCKMGQALRHREETEMRLLQLQRERRCPGPAQSYPCHPPKACGGKRSPSGTG